MKPSIEAERKAMRIDRSIISIGKSTDKSDEIAYWRSQTAEARLRYAEILRRTLYGSRATERMVKVLEIAKRSES